MPNPACLPVAIPQFPQYFQSRGGKSPIKWMPRKRNMRIAHNYSFLMLLLTNIWVQQRPNEFKDHSFTLPKSVWWYPEWGLPGVCIMSVCIMSMCTWWGGFSEKSTDLTPASVYPRTGWSGDAVAVVGSTLPPASEFLESWVFWGCPRSPPFLNSLFPWAACRLRSVGFGTSQAGLGWGGVAGWIEGVPLFLGSQECWTSAACRFVFRWQQLSGLCTVFTASRGMLNELTPNLITTF